MMNPVLRKEAITTMRSWKTYGALVLFLVISAVGAMLYIDLSMFQNRDLSFDPSAMVWLYVVLAAVQMGLVLLTAPAVAAGSISGERERQTLDLLLVTKMSPLSIVLGKLASSLMYVMLLVVATLPIFAIAFYFGAVSVVQVAEVFAFVLVTACMVGRRKIQKHMVGSVSVFFSCLFKRTIVSIVLMYLVIGFLCFGTLVLLAFYYMSYDGLYNGDIPVLATILILIPNPGVAFFSLMDAQLGTDVTFSLLRMSDQTSAIYQWMGTHIWLLHLVFDLVVIVVFVLLSAYIINPVREKKVRKKKG